MLYTITALLGVLLIAPSAAVLAVQWGLVVSGGYAVAHGCATAAPPPGRRLVTVGAVTAGVAPFVVATKAMGTVGVLVGLTVLTLATVVWTCRIERAVPAGTVIAPGTGADSPVLRELLVVLPLEVVCEEWVTSVAPAWNGGTRGHRAPATYRELLLEELRARDPDGTRRWLVEGPEEPPGRYLHEDRAPT